MDVEVEVVAERGVGVGEGVWTEAEVSVCKGRNSSIRHARSNVPSILKVMK